MAKPKHTERFSYKGKKEKVAPRAESASKPTRTMTSDLTDADIDTLRALLNVKLNLAGEKNYHYNDLAPETLKQFDASIAKTKEYVDGEPLCFANLEAAFTDANIASMCHRAVEATMGGTLFGGAGFGPELAKIVKSAVDQFIDQRVVRTPVPPRN